MLRLPKKKGGVSKVSRKKVKKKILKVTYPLLSGRMKSVFLLLPRVLLVGGASVGGLEVAGLDLLADLSLVGPFLLGVEMFVTLTFFSQPEGYSPACQYHPFSPRPIQRWQMGSVFWYTLAQIWRVGASED